MHSFNADPIKICVYICLCLSSSAIKLGIYYGGINFLKLSLKYKKLSNMKLPIITALVIFLTMGMQSMTVRSTYCETHTRMLIFCFNFSEISDKLFRALWAKFRVLCMHKLPRQSHFPSKYPS